jgi:hypothetical protein
VGGWSTPRPSCLLLGKTRYPLYRRLDGPQGRFGLVRKILPPTGIRSPDRPAYRESLYRLRYPGPLYITWSRDSVFRIATRYGLEGPGIESRWGEIFRTYPDWLWGPPSLLYNGYRVFPGGKGGQGVMLTTHPLLVSRLRKSRAIPPLTLWVLLGLLRGSLYPLLYITCT